MFKDSEFFPISLDKTALGPLAATELTTIHYCSLITAKSKGLASHVLVIPSKLASSIDF